ncbi:MAG: ankyrin repeat domain-containing protein, partial [Verrucomicrobiota bacterium]
MGCVVALGIFFAGGLSLTLAETSLIDDAEQRQWDRVRAAIETAAKEEQIDGMTALHWAAFHEEADVAQGLLKAGANARAENRYGVTPLDLACVNGDEAMVKILLDAGADPNRTLEGGESVLMTAARTGIPG